MVECAEKNEPMGFYHAILEFVETGVEATGNSVLGRIIAGIMPNLRRLQYLSIILRKSSFPDCTHYFKEIVGALNARDPQRGVAALEAYIEGEKEFAIGALKQSRFAHYIDDGTG